MKQAFKDYKGRNKHKTMKAWLMLRIIASEGTVNRRDSLTLVR